MGCRLRAALDLSIGDAPHIGLCLRIHVIKPWAVLATRAKDNRAVSFSMEAAVWVLVGGRRWVVATEALLGTRGWWEQAATASPIDAGAGTPLGPVHVTAQRVVKGARAGRESGAELAMRAGDGAIVKQSGPSISGWNPISGWTTRATPVQ